MSFIQIDTFKTKTPNGIFRLLYVRIHRFIIGIGTNILSSSRKQEEFTASSQKCERKESPLKPPKFYKLIITAPDGRFGTKVIAGGITKNTAKHEANRFRDLGMIVKIIEPTKEI